MRKKQKAMTGFTLTMVVALGFAVFFYMNFKTVVVSGESMLPTLKSGQRVLVSKAYWLIGPIRRKDIVVIADENPENEDGYIIKRVYRMPGEVVDYANVPAEHKLSDGDYVVPDGKVYLLGDNRPASEDSRKFGAVPLASIIGKVVVLR
jgi:signal peptidase I